MITVGDVMNMRAFDSIWLAAPCEGAAEREVTGVGTLDHEPFTRCSRSSSTAWRRWP